MTVDCSSCHLVNSLPPSKPLAWCDLHCPSSCPTFSIGRVRLEATLSPCIQTRGRTMTAPLTSDAFLELLRKSGLLEQDRLEPQLQRLQTLAAPPSEPMAIA